jgi:hypothetical protein
MRPSQAVPTGTLREIPRRVIGVLGLAGIALVTRRATSRRAAHCGVVTGPRGHDAASTGRAGVDPAKAVITVLPRTPLEIVYV